MGPIFQVLFIWILGKFIDSYNLIIFERYSKWILMFNLLPIYPLDGGKLIYIILGRFFSYYKSLQVTIYFSYFIFLILVLVIAFFYQQFTLFLIFTLLGFNLFKEIKKTTDYYYRFLFERYINEYHFKRIKKIAKLNNMKRDTFHIISSISEKDYLTRYVFNSLSK